MVEHDTRISFFQGVQFQCYVFNRYYLNRVSVTMGKGRGEDQEREDDVREVMQIKVKLCEMFNFFLVCLSFIVWELSYNLYFNGVFS